MKYFSILWIILISWRVSGYTINNRTLESDQIDSHIDIEDASIIDRILEAINRYRNLLNNAVIELIESQRHLIKPLDPLYIEDLMLQPDDVVGFDSFEMTLKESILKGLYDFKIEQVDIRPLGLSAVISISFEKLVMEGFHETHARLFGQIFPIVIDGSGRYSLTFNNFKVTAYVDFKLNEQNRLNIKTMVAAYSVSSVSSNFEGFGSSTIIFNSAMNIAIPALIIASNVEANLWINQELIPAINGIINDLTILDIISIIRNLIRNDAINFDTEIINELSLIDKQFVSSNDYNKIP